MSEQIVPEQQSGLNCVLKRHRTSPKFNKKKKFFLIKPENRITLTFDDSLWNNCSAAKYGWRLVIKNKTLELYKAGSSSCSSVLIRSNFRLTSSNCSLAFMTFASSFFLPTVPPLLTSWLLCLWLS